MHFRILRKMGEEDRVSRRRVFRWSGAAREMVRANLQASGKELSLLVNELVRESGYPRWACWRFVRKMGVRSKRPERAWTEAEHARLLKLIDLHPVTEIARLLRRTTSSVWHMLYRLGANAAMGKDGFTKYTLASALHVAPAQIETWIQRGWLRAREVHTGQLKRVMIAGEDFCEFCKQHTHDVVGNRLNKERLEFVYRFAFPPSHSELLPVRESKKERQAYESRVTGEPERKRPSAVRQDDEDVKLDRGA